MVYYLYIIPEIGILDWLSSPPNLGNNILPLYNFPKLGYYIGYLVLQIWGIIYYPYMIPEIGISDWLSSTPNLGNDILHLYNSRDRDTRLVI